MPQNHFSLPIPLTIFFSLTPPLSVLRCSWYQSIFFIVCFHFWFHFTPFMIAMVFASLVTYIHFLASFFSNPSGIVFCLDNMSHVCEKKFSLSLCDMHAFIVDKYNSIWYSIYDANCLLYSNNISSEMWMNIFVLSLFSAFFILFFLNEPCHFHIYSFYTATDFDLGIIFAFKL